MITEDYVSFEVAKLLEENGFNWDCETMKFYPEPDYDQESPDGIYAPTLQMAMKWVREVHGLNIYARGVWKDVEVQYGDWEPAVVGYDWFVESLMDDTYSKMSTEQFLTYEQACEAAVKYCLENLIKDESTRFARR